MTRARALIIASSLAAVPSAAVAQQAGSWGAVECTAGETDVLLLGTFHMAGSSDDFQRDVIDVLEPDRQAQLEDLVRRVAAFRPTAIVVEYPYDVADTLQTAYERYLAADGETDRRNEIAQIGFRLARRLGHETVYPFDYRMGIGNDSIGAYLGRNPDAARARAARSQEIQQSLVAEDSLLRRVGLVEYYRYINSEERIRSGNELMYRAIALGDGANYGGPRMLSRWYDRNFRMVHHLTRLSDDAGNRVLVLVGSGHVLPLRHILDVSPGLCPVSPLPYLSG